MKYDHSVLLYLFIEHLQTVKILTHTFCLSFTLAPLPLAPTLQPHLVILLSQALPKAHRQTPPLPQSPRRCRLQLLQHRSFRQMKQAEKRASMVRLQPPRHLSHPPSHLLPHLLVFPNPLVQMDKQQYRPILRGHQAGRTADQRSRTEWRV